MKKIHLLGLAILSGLLLSIAWPANGFPALLFVSFVPLLLIEDHISRNRENFHGYSFFFYSYLAFLVWNILTTWWIMNSTVFGAIMAIILNSLFQAIAIHLFHYSKSKLNHKKHAYIFLVFYWITYEYLHLDWDLSWSWLNLGNGFANFHQWIQWYEYTGAFGGTLWILMANFIVFRIINDFKSLSKASIYMKVTALSLLISLPIAFSYYIYASYEEEINPVEIVVVQPNTDPYNEQYELSVDVLLGRVLDLAETEVDSNTSYLVCPESTLQESIWENNPEDSHSINLLRKYATKYPDLGIIIGGSTYRRYDEGEPLPETVRWHKRAEFWYNVYNTAIFIEDDEALELYHKSKLVPGVEKMPFPKYLKFLKRFAIDLGGTIGSIGYDKVRTVFVPSNEDLPPVGAAICYESVYGDFYSRFVRNGAEIMLIITNDGWWGNTPGHKQHLSFARIRALENRRSIARSANTGISCFVNQRGDIYDATAYWEPAVIKSSINANSKLTLYSKYGDYIGRYFGFVSVLLLLISIVNGIIGKKKGQIVG